MWATRAKNLPTTITMTTSTCHEFYVGVDIIPAGSTSSGPLNRVGNSE
jgi:hypothetical protein